MYLLWSLLAKGRGVLREMASTHQAEPSVQVVVILPQQLDALIDIRVVAIPAQRRAELLEPGIERRT